MCSALGGFTVNVPDVLGLSGYPVLSVIIPVYNAERYLVRCLDSILASTYTDFEAICVDDGSSDGSLEILRKYAQKDARFRILTQDHQYAGAARNAGIRAASGKYIHFLDADDEILPFAYAKLIEAAEAAQSDVCECLYTNIHAKTERVISQPDYRPYDESYPLSLDSVEENKISLLHGDVIPWNKLYLRSFLIENACFFDDLICAEDRSFYFNVIFKFPRILRLQDRLVLHRLGDRSSLDGGSTRLRYFEVEFRSFEHIWDMAKALPDDVKRQILDICIGDSIYFFLHSVRTVYEGPIRDMICAYWPPYFPLLGNSIRSSWWYTLYRILLVSGENKRYRRFLLALNTLIQKLNTTDCLPARYARRAIKALLRHLIRKH